jgi:hypothetical protein
MLFEFSALRSLTMVFIGLRPTHSRSHMLATAMRSTLSLVLALLAFSVWGCSGDDTGICCTASDMNLIPQPEVDPQTGEPRNIIRFDLKFNCEDALCVSYQASPAFCTKPCQFDDACAEGFACLPVLQSDPGPAADIRAGDKFCVRKVEMCTKD